MFLDTINTIKTRVGEQTLLDDWSATLTSVWDESPTVSRITVDYTKGDFTLTKELKLVEEHFQEIESYDTEIARHLSRYSEFTKTIAQIEGIAEANRVDPPIVEEYWKAALLEVIVNDPTSVVAHFEFFRQGDSFRKDFSISAESFVSLSFYYEELGRILTQLNTPVVIDTSYYEAIIQNTSY